MTTISNNTLVANNFKPQAANAPVAQPKSVDGMVGDRLVLNPIQVGQIQWLQPSREQLERNLQVAQLREGMAAFQVQQAQQAVDNAPTPLQRMLARQQLTSAQRNLHTAQLNVAKSQVALDQRDVDDANQAVATAEQAVMGAKTPWGRMIAMKQLEAASKNQAKAEDKLTTDHQTLLGLEFQGLVVPEPPVIFKAG